MTNRAEQEAAEQERARQKAKSVYVAGGDVNSCGDWLALALKDAFRTDSGFDLTAFKQALKGTVSKRQESIWSATTQPVASACAGLMLRRHAAKRGFVVISGKKIVVPGAKNQRGKKTTQ